MSTEERWDDWLVAEHELIERAMAVLKKNLDQVMQGHPDFLQMRRAVDFLLEFGDKVHNTKEERFLFPRMRERGIPAEGGPIGVMLLEHDMERRLLAGMQGLLGGLSAADEESRRRFVQDGLEYLKVRAEHIWKENDILYAMGRQVLGPEDAAFLVEEFARLDQESYGPGARAKFQQMVKEAEEGGTRRRLVEELSAAQLHGIFETLPFEVTFVDAADTVAYFNRLDKQKIFPRTRSVIGRRVEKCHPEKSVHMVERIVEGFKNRTLDKAEFWIDFRGDKVLIRYLPVYDDDDGSYLGVLEITQEVGWIQQLTGQKRLLD
ncbi:MAG: hypothetical protein BWK76_12815 [Desulfobulbaceae bacterium A2]|nr:MAG: hypothetical protein BWK76_12815 [Desulfobulbaceae bacterium A2]